MSRGFVKEGDQEEAPIIPPRAALPEGVINYVTPVGLNQLQKEQDELENDLLQLGALEEREQRRKRAEITGKLNLLRERLSSARVIDPNQQPRGEIRFGAIVVYQIGGNAQSIKIQIVGVDEANVKKQKVAFVSPIARAMTGKKVDDEFSFKLGAEDKQVKIIAINYSV